MRRPLLVGQNVIDLSRVSRVSVERRSDRVRVWIEWVENSPSMAVRLALKPDEADHLARCIAEAIAMQKDRQWISVSNDGCVVLHQT